MNVALVGSCGYISQFLQRRFQKEKIINNVLKIGRADNSDIKFNLLNPEEFDYQILKEIDFVVFTAAVSSPDICDLEYDLCWKINVDGTKYFIRRAIENNCKVLFFSSDAVFGEQEDWINTEESKTSAKTAYGKMKKEIEDTFGMCKQFKAIRLSYVVSAKDKFVKYCMECMEKEQVAEIFHPFYRNCITISDVIDVVMWMLKNWNKYDPYVLNVGGMELVSRIRIADELNRIWKDKLQYTIISPGVDFYKNRPRITEIKSLYLYRCGILDNACFSDKFRKELEEKK